MLYGDLRFLGVFACLFRYKYVFCLIGSHLGFTLPRWSTKLNAALEEQS